MPIDVPSHVGPRPGTEKELLFSESRCERKKRHGAKENPGETYIYNMPTQLKLLSTFDRNDLKRTFAAWYIGSRFQWLGFDSNRKFTCQWS